VILEFDDLDEINGKWLGGNPYTGWVMMRGRPYVVFVSISASLRDLLSLTIVEHGIGFS
jgi:hypothetical protein